jgi:hypothetical protein
MNAEGASDPETRPVLQHDALTLAAIAVLVYSLSTLAHEGLGHGGACVLLGGRLDHVSSVMCACDAAGLAPWPVRLIGAAGTLADFLLGCTAWAVLQYHRPSSPPARFFWWLLMTATLLSAGGYLMVPTLIGFGDWISFLQGLEPHWLWRACLILLGVGISLRALLTAVRELEPFLGREGRRRTAARLTLIPYLTGGLISCAAGLLNPDGMILVGISAAAASFGGTAWLAWLPAWVRPEPPAKEPASRFIVQRSPVWIAAGAVALALFVGVLGPSIRFQP